MNMFEHFLEELFIELDKRKVNYLVLRGYEDLPKIVHYDVDLAVINEAGLYPFFIVLQDLSTKYNYKIEKDTIRQGLLKLILNFGNTILKLDVFCEFRYAGLEYIEMEELFHNKRKIISQISVPDNNYELAISLLKEILHNSRIRKDKVYVMRNLYNEKYFSSPFKKYFTEKSIDNFSKALFIENKFEFKGIAMQARIDLLLFNIKKYSFVLCIQNIYKFFWIKYFNQNYYDNYIFPVRNEMNLNKQKLK